jgi:hypothetical protein
MAKIPINHVVDGFVEFQNISSNLEGHTGTDHLGFFGATPVVKTAVADPAALTAGATVTAIDADVQAIRNDVAALRTKLAALLDALQALGLV